MFLEQFLNDSFASNLQIEQQQLCSLKLYQNKNLNNFF